MAIGLTVKQRKHADLYLKTGNGTRAAMAVYGTTNENSAASISSENLRKVKIQEYIGMRAEKAARFVYELAESSENDTVRLNASKDILDRAGLRAVEETRSIVAHVYSGSVAIDSLASKVAEELAARKLLE